MEIKKKKTGSLFKRKKGMRNASWFSPCISKWITILNLPHNFYFPLILNLFVFNLVTSEDQKLCRLSFGLGNHIGPIRRCSNGLELQAQYGNIYILFFFIEWQYLLNNLNNLSLQSHIKIDVWMTHAHFLIFFILKKESFLHDDSCSS